MAAYVITDGAFDAELLRRILPPDLIKDVVFVEANGLSDMESLARSLVVMRMTPVAIVMDAECCSPKIVEERRQSVEEVVRIVAGKTPVKVIVAVPALESILFHDAALLERVFGHPIPADILSLGRTNPKEALDHLHAKSKTIRNPTKLLKSLVSPDVEVLRQTPPIQELIEFLQHARQLSLSPTPAPAGT